MYGMFCAMVDEIVTSGVQQDSEHGEQILKTARARLHAEDGPLPWPRYRDIEKQAVIRHISDQQPVQPYLAVLGMLRDAGEDRRSAFIGFDQVESWRNAIRAALAVPPWFADIYQNAEAFSIMNARAINVANSVKTLRDAGFPVTMVDGNPSDEGELRAIEHALLDRVKQQPALHCIILRGQLRSRYDESRDRYRFTRVLSSGETKKCGAYPLGHLYLAVATALTSLGNGPTFEVTSDELVRAEETWNLYRAYASVIDVEQWTMYESMFMHAASSLRSLRERVLYEQNFTLRQQTPAQTLQMLELVLSPFGNQERFPGLPFAPAEVTALAQAILGLVDGSSSVRFTVSTVAARAGIAESCAQNILDALSIEAGAHDALDLSFGDLSSAAVMYRPLLRFGNEYLLLDRLIAGPAFYEAIASAYRAVVGRSFEEIVGFEGLEFAVRQLLQSHGITPYAGGYGVEDLECDAVVESPTAIIFVEAKKKGLTRRSLAGEPEKLLFDVSRSVIAAHVQLARHELSLRRTGRLQFDDGRALVLGDREVHRVAITLLDLGSLQDKVVVAEMLRVFRGSTFHAGRELSDDDKRAAAEFDRQGGILHDTFGKLGTLAPDWERRQRFAVRSYCLTQFMVLLSDVASPEDFVRNLQIDRHLTTATGDWYEEYRLMQSLPKSN